ncbi:MAG: hypothetical protein JEZ07_15090 [Phycisphaerae bacterium]|nr:hypothetical protein [Phycisphaerae bacterium]
MKKGNKGQKGWNWPAVVSCFVVGLVIQATMLPCMCRIGQIKMTVALMIDLLVVIRLGTAYLRREKGKGWVFYSILCILSGLIVELGSMVFVNH